MFSFIKKSFKYFVFGMLFSILIIKFHSNSSDILITNSKYIINFLFTILALSVAIITLLYSTIDKIRNTIIKIDILKDEEISEIEMIIKEVFDELRDDTYFILYSLIFILILILIEGCDIPFVSWSSIIPISRVEFVLALKMTILFLNILALVDIIHSLFSIIKASNKISHTNQK